MQPFTVGPVAIDDRWRMMIPAFVIKNEELQPGGKVFFKNNSDGSVSIYFRKESAKGLSIEVMIDRQGRIIVPRVLREWPAFISRERFNKKYVVYEKGSQLKVYRELPEGD